MQKIADMANICTILKSFHFPRDLLAFVIEQFPDRNQAGFCYVHVSGVARGGSKGARAPPLPTGAWPKHPFR